MDPFCYFMICVCHAVLSVHCSLVVTCWERPNLLALLYVRVLCFVTFSCGVLGQVFYLIVSIPDLCLLPYILFLFTGSIKRICDGNSRWKPPKYNCVQDTITEIQKEVI